ncbi:MAG: tRNA (adenosine(37)-N6)-threonylcarbamoyltransferase complex dimerization subunit type 1 TsaB [Chitinophagales bacterium]
MTGPIILHIESSSDICSVAVSRGSILIDCIEGNEKNAHAQNLLPFIDRLLSQNNILKTELAAVSISAGPGSYTGLRIGTSTAKALSYSLKIPLISVCTLKSLASAAKDQLPDAKHYIPFIDARRLEVYTAIINHDIEYLRKPEAIDFAKQDFNFPEKAVFFGNGSIKMEEHINENAGIMLNNINFSAKNLIKTAFSQYSIKYFDDVAYFVPNYLKNYQLNKSKI